MESYLTIDDKHDVSTKKMEKNKNVVFVGLDLRKCFWYCRELVPSFFVPLLYARVLFNKKETRETLLRLIQPMSLTRALSFYHSSLCKKYSSKLMHSKQELVDKQEYLEFLHSGLCVELIMRKRNSQFTVPCFIEEVLGQVREQTDFESSYFSTQVCEQIETILNNQSNDPKVERSKIVEEWVNKSTENWLRVSLELPYEPLENINNQNSLFASIVLKI